MDEYPSARAFVPDHVGIDELRAAALSCRGCPLYADATQTVFGAGPPACRPWLAAELREIDPDVIVALGATAGKSLVGNDFRVTKSRGVAMAWPAPGMAATDRRRIVLVPTIHPSAVLRATDRDEAYAGLVADLTVAARVLAGASAS